MLTWGFGFWMWRPTLALIVLFLLSANYSVVMCRVWPGTLVTWPWRQVASSRNSLQPLAVLWVFAIMCFLYWHSFYQIDHCLLWWTLVAVDWFTSCQECHWEVFWARYCSSCTPPIFFPFLFWRISLSHKSKTTRFIWSLIHVPKAKFNFW